jgi:hypothetical protein
MKQMLTAQPGMRRILDAFDGLLLEGHAEHSENAAALPHWREALIRAQRKVIERYREVLATGDIPQAERTSIESRIAAVETEIADLQGTPSRLPQSGVETQHGM